GALIGDHPGARGVGREAGGAPGRAPARAAGPVTEEAVWEQLRNCYDPEIPVNVVDLGLVYDLTIKPHRSGRSRVEVKMTLTAPGCGMGPAIAADAQQKIASLPGVAEAEVGIVWDPPWSADMMTAEGKRRLGLG
ncbi:MAG TPA: iron-sulfur cluster assembly protein, partial [Thermoanaerobaculia bacterium]|nr:iron-sulfur cluster assembly protein [Thermoanaerobaculia bacterium]